MLASIVYPERNRGKIEVFDYFKRVKKFLLSHYSIILLLKFFNEIFIPNNLEETKKFAFSFFFFENCAQFIGKISQRRYRLPNDYFTTFPYL